MLKKAPSRNHRTKGIKLKHILQIALLLGVCFWLVYQLKHSHDKKVVLDEKSAKASIRSLSEGELLKLGRKDLPHKDVGKNVKQEVEGEDETVGDEEEKHEVEGLEEEGQKHEADEREDEDRKEEQEEEENKNEDIEEEGGAGDDEIDENEQEKKEGRTDHEEDLVDDEKEREDEEDDEKGEKDGERNESEERMGRADNENSSANQDNRGDKNAHEAREENYRRDDASSAVTHNAQVISTETEEVSSESANENSGSGALEKEVKSNYTEDLNGNQNSSRLLDGRTAGNDTASVAATEEKVNENLPNAVNATMKLQSDDIPEADSNSTIVSIEASNSSPEVNQANGTEALSVSGLSQNVTLDGMTTREEITGKTLIVEQTNNTISDNNHSDSNATVPSDKAESNVSEKILRYNGTAQVEDDSRSLTMNESMDAMKNEELKNEELKNEDTNKNEDLKNENATKNKESNGTRESDRIGDSSDSRNGTQYAVQHDPIDSSDSLVSEDKKGAHTDLDTSPEMKTDGHENGQAAAE
ncbi:uncharacterized protein LOC126802933 [Argentina anserina]|uniref:uncharacterized protein LOC126802933 n=1 Tax=Argentina anserina TaxID=57926 RepID=UPI00217684F4|nr:uncharacterized protein LOC126802933 [Potentilla anserina]XP_050386612.1 uncharacterized protein LOC126802933 [Potentilla anserina]XP_050386613.1 uncharacterized protein LOC126802933 [Potentilla anserina]